MIEARARMGRQVILHRHGHEGHWDGTLRMIDEETFEHSSGQTFTLDEVYWTSRTAATIILSSPVDSDR